MTFGAFALLEGPFAILLGLLSWLANPLWLLAALLVLLSRFTGGAAVSLMAFAVANHAWVFCARTIPADEGGVTKLHLTSFHFGFYLWLLSFLLLAAGAIVARSKSAQSPPGAVDFLP